MKIAIVAIGDELLAGHTVNTNAAFIAEKLLERGYTIMRHCVLSDAEKPLEKGLKDALKRADVIIVTGGLGPTLDDKTKKILCKLFQTSLVYKKEIADDLHARYQNLSSIDEQSTIPEKAAFFKNRLGTAPGLVFSTEKKTMICMPGVPTEMKEMFLLDVLPFMEKNLPLKKKLFEKRLFLALLPEVDVDPYLRELEKEFPKVNIGIYPAYALLQVRFSIKTKKEERAMQILDKVMGKLKEKYSSYIYSEKSFDIAVALHELLIEKNLKIAFAESCTGGALSSSMTKIPGSSKYFLGGVVSYSNSMKEKLLGVSSKTLEHYGAVSEETVKEMAKGIFSITLSDYTIAISGIAGPTGATKDKPLGTVCIAVAKRDEEPKTGMIHVVGNRAIVIAYAVNYALSLLYRKIAFNINPFEE